VCQAALKVKSFLLLCSTIAILGSWYRNGSNGSLPCEHAFLITVLGTSIGKKRLKESTQPDWTTKTKSPGSGNKKRIDHSNSLKLPRSKHGLEYISYQCENTYMRVYAAPPAYIHRYSPGCVATKYLAVFASIVPY